MTKHTQGPWQVCADEKEYNNAPLLIWGPRGPGYGTIAEATKYIYEAEANARLIAAAPEMLEVLARVEFWLSTVSDGGAIQNVVREVIAKATGK